MTVMDGITETAMAMDGRMVTVMEGLMAMLRQQRQRMAQRQRDGDGNSGRRDGNGNGQRDDNGDGRRNIDAMMTMAMDSVRAAVINGAMAMQWQRKARRQCYGNGRHNGDGRCNCYGWHDSDSNGVGGNGQHNGGGNGRCNGNVAATAVMDGVTAKKKDGRTKTQWQQQQWQWMARWRWQW